MFFSLKKIIPRTKSKVICPSQENSAPVSKSTNLCKCFPGLEVTIVCSFSYWTIENITATPTGGESRSPRTVFHFAFRTYRLLLLLTQCVGFDNIQLKTKFDLFVPQTLLHPKSLFQKPWFHWCQRSLSHFWPVVLWFSSYNPQSLSPFSSPRWLLPDATWKSQVILL